MQLSQVRRWRAPLVVASVVGFAFALVTGSVLLFMGAYLEDRDWWGLVHWTAALAGLVPYAVYQLRHYLRVREYAQTTHYKVGLQAFFVVCATLLSGIPLITPLVRGTTSYTVVDLVHMFFGFVFVILLSAHLTLVSVVTVARAAEEGEAARASVRHLFVLSGLLTALLTAVAIGLAGRFPPP
jgi:hypothetical protein